MKQNTKRVLKSSVIILGLASQAIPVSEARSLNARSLLECDPSDILCRHQTDPTPENVSGIDNAFERPSTAPVTPPPISPTLSPSSSTTAPMTISPTPPPTLPECAVDVTGFYGDATAPPSELDFFYQVEVVVGTTAGDLETEILDKLERSIINRILPTLFSDECARRIRIRRRLQTTVSGISTQVADQVLEGVKCRINVTSDCFVLDGQMTIYDDNPESAKPLVLGIVQQAMQSGFFNEGVDPRIESVKYLDDLDPDSLVDNSGQDPKTLESDTTNGIPVWGFVLIGIGAFLGLFALCACPCPFKRKDEDNSSEAQSAEQQQANLLTANEVNQTGTSGEMERVGIY